MDARAPELVRAAIAAWIAAAPARAAALQLGRPSRPAERAVLRVLGARQAVQAAVVGRTGWRSLSALVDVLHGASMLALAAVAPRRYGRAALIQAASAALLVLLEVRASDRR